MSEEKSQDSPASEDLPKETIIIVGCVCGSVVIILTIVLIVLCCKRQQNKHQYEKQQGTQLSPVMSSNPSPEPEEGSLPSKPVIRSGVDNPGLDQTDNSPVDPGKPRDGPFVTNTSAQPHMSNHQPWENPNPLPPAYDRRNEHPGYEHNRKNQPSSYDHHRNDRSGPSGYGNNRNDPPNYDNYRNEPQNYDNHRNEPPNYDNHRNEQVSRQRSTAASPAEQYYQETHLNLREESEPSTESHKPRKVIYEVVV